MRKFAFLFAAAVFTFALVSSAKADDFKGFQKGDWSLTLSGGGVSDKDLDDTSFSLSVSPSYFVSDSFEIGLRQGATYNDGFSGATTVFIDYNFRMQNPKWVPFVGANFGYSYGEDVEDAWRAGPEVGLKYFVNDSTFLYGRAAYEFDLNDGFDSGGFVYGLGIGFRF